MNIKETVQGILERYPHTRDNDRLLISKFWNIEISKSKDRFRFEDTYIFMNAFINGDITFPDTITRARRDIQKSNHNLRGDKYSERHSISEDCKTELGRDIMLYN